MTRRVNGEGSKPIKRKDGRWQIGLFYLDPDTGAQKRTTVVAKTRAEVIVKRDEVRDRLKRSQPAKDANVRLEDFALAWADTSLEASERKATTKRWYRGLIASHIVGSALGRTTLDRLRPRSVEVWLLGMRQKGLADSTVRSAFTVLGVILADAVRDGLIAVSPAAGLHRPRIRDRKEAAYLSPDEINRLLEAAEWTRYAPLFKLLVNTGMRRGEALALRWADVPEAGADFATATIRVAGTLVRVDGVLTVTEPKTTSSGRPIPVTEGAMEVFRYLRQRERLERLAAGSQWRQTGFVFTTELGEPCDPRNALRAFKIAAARAGLPANVGLHTLRHSAASAMLMANVPLKVVSEIFGHSSISITADIYGHVAPEVQRGAMDKLGAALGGQSRA